MLLLVSCTTGSTRPLAKQVLAEFLDALYYEKYDEAALLYGGSYDIMIEHNPAIDPNAHAALLKNACTINGAACLEVKGITLESEVSDSEYIFKVEFMNEDGTLFVQGPCCGGSEVDSPSQSEFSFTVLKNIDGKFLVMNMPPYTP